MSKFLSLGLHNPNQLVRALSLTGLSSVLMQPKKVRGPRSTGVGGGLGRRGHLEKSLHDRWGWKGADREAGRAGGGCGV